MRRFLPILCLLIMFTGCSDDSQGGPWSISDDGDAGVEEEDGDSGVSEDDTADTGPEGPEFVGEAFLLATALERVAVTARDRHSSLCVFIVLVWPGNLGIYDDVEMSEDWGIESIVARPDGCPDQGWPAREGLQPEAASGRIDLYQSMGANRWTSVSVDLTLTFPENDGDVPRQIVLDFPNLEL